MPSGGFRQRDGRREQSYDPHRMGPRPRTLRERLQRVVSSSRPYASTEVSKKEASLLLDTMSWRERRERDGEEDRGRVDAAESVPILSLASSKPSTSYRAKKRKTRYAKYVRAGCDVCEPTLATIWHNIGSAARHHDATGHPTWSESHVKVWYGVEEESRTRTSTSNRDEEDYIPLLDDEES